MDDIDNWVKKSYVKCVVPSCSQRREIGISFHKFPDKRRHTNRYHEWVKALQLEYNPNQYAVICSRHFKINDFYYIKTSDQKKLILRSEAIPHIFQELPGKQIHELGDARDVHAEEHTVKRLNNDSIVYETRHNDISFHDQVPDSVKQIPEVGETREEYIEAQTVKKETNDSFISQVNNNFNDIGFHEARMYINAEVQVDTRDIDSLWLKPERPTLVLKTEEQLTAWTGLGQFKLLDVIVQAVQMVPEATMFAKWDISIRNLVTLVFVKLKTNLSFRCISSMYGVCPKTCSKYFNTFIPILADVMRIAVPWFDKDIVSNDLPYHFRQYKNVRAVLDCTEIPIQRPTCLHCRIISYSHYKGRETAKYMVSITPGGCFNFISPGYVGKASDKFIFNHCDILPLFDKHDAVMVDKGFSISQELAAHHLEMIRPPTLFDGQLSKEKCFYREC
ncbi:uncharacterized protein LOC134204691 [Armigeres subalbatus]|uniref:uncharacterized protein LOC134204691 n=1 Tax=Armigeres subalbatus TaxID=124917 RepID=UPI002ED3A1A4